MSIFDAAKFQFPYNYKFPGQASNERILYVTRENRSMLWFRRLSVVLVALVIVILGYGIDALWLTLTQDIVLGATIFGLIFAAIFLIVGWWWVTTLYMKSLAVLSTQRLSKVVYTTPFNRHILTLPLEMIVDTGSYTKGFLQAFFKLGTFTARSSAASSGVATDDSDSGRINKKYFYIENIAAAEDLQHYINKVLPVFRNSPEKLANFRPFIPDLKGDARQKFMEQYPEYWS